MKQFPVLDSRTKQDLLAQIAARARRYTPEWRLDFEQPDAGAALAELFGGMLYETICRYNRIPYKQFLYFLNMLDTRRTPATPAVGYARFSCETPDARGAHVEKGTQLYAQSGGGEDVLYETDSGFDASAAVLEGLLLVHPQADCIEWYDALSGDAAELFGAHPERNLQSHILYLGHPDLFLLHTPCMVEVELHTDVELLSGQAAEQLAQPQSAKWEYYDGARWSAFDHAEARQKTILLQKTADGPMEAQGADAPACIRCVMQGAQPEIRLRAARLRTSPLRDAALEAEELFYNDLPIDRALGGYCFGREPVPYDCFYLASAEAFSKRGARLKIELEMRTVVVQQMTPDQRYEFNKKYIIDKNDRLTSVPEIYISQVIWEYWNGTGWKRLFVEGDANPFACRREGRMELSCVCPADMEPVTVGAVENYWLRARVGFVENNFSTTGDRLLPFVQGVRLQYAYDETQPAHYVRSDNNCESQILADAHRLENLALDAFESPEQTPPAVYLCFDRPFCGYPVNLFFDLDGQCEGIDRLEVQALLADGFQKVNAADRTDGLSGSGILSVYLGEPPARGRLFGHEGYFLRILGERRARRGALPRVTRVLTNVAGITQSHRELDQLFAADIHETGREIVLPHRPVLSCEVWVDELPELPQQERDRLLDDPKAPIRPEYDEEGALIRLRVRWEETDSFSGTGPESRVYQIDRIEGRLTFGNGRRGKVPAAGEESILVQYSSGGGSRGNLPAGRIGGMVGSIAYITGVTNITPTCGGSDLQTMEAVERLGPRRVRHRYRAICARDYEDLIGEQFGEAMQVKCFSNTGVDGRPAPGAVTVVVMARDFNNRDYVLRLCRRIRAMLEDCCDCMALERLAVIPAVVMTVNVTVHLMPDDLDNAAQVERDAIAAIRRLLEPSDGRGLIRGIGELPAAADFYSRLKYVEHVAAVRDVFLEGDYYEDGRRRLVSLDGSVSVPFTVVQGGTHRVRM